MSADNVLGCEIVQMFIFRAISQPGTLSADIPDAWRGLFTKYTHRSDISTQKRNDYKSLWIEIQNNMGRNAICGIFIDTHMAM